MSNSLSCTEFPCQDVLHERYTIPRLPEKNKSIKVILISECCPENPYDYYYSKGGLFEKTTIDAFKNAGLVAESIEELVDHGIYFTTAIKCSKKKYLVSANTIKNCSRILEKEIELFANASVLLLMGDVAIKCLNYISKRLYDKICIPKESTYKIRGTKYSFGDKIAIPSYLQAGKAYFIETTKREMLTEDISRALEIAKIK